MNTGREICEACDEYWPCGHAWRGDFITTCSSEYAFHIEHSNFYSEWFDRWQCSDAMGTIKKFCIKLLCQRTKTVATELSRNGQGFWKCCMSDEIVSSAYEIFELSQVTGMNRVSLMTVKKKPSDSGKETSSIISCLMCFLTLFFSFVCL